jgi:hypothetical protein
MVDDYQLIPLSAELILIQWQRTPTPAVEDQYLDALKNLLDESDHPLYFLSDLRKGRIMGMRAIKRLGELTHHPKWAGSTAFSHNPITKMLVSNFRHYAMDTRSRNEMHNTPEQAIAFLENLRPGITDGVDFSPYISLLNAPADSSTSHSA